MTLALLFGRKGDQGGGGGVVEGGVCSVGVAAGAAASSVVGGAGVDGDEAGEVDCVVVGGAEGEDGVDWAPSN